MKNTQPTVRIGILLLLLASGMAVLVYLQPERLKAPAWIAFFALGLLGFAGVCIIVQALRLNILVRWLVCMLLSAMTVVPAWIALGSGPRQCTMVSVGAWFAVSEVICRGVFGVGAAILAIMFVFAVHDALRSRHAN